MTPSGIEPATFRFVAQMRRHVPKGKGKVHPRTRQEYNVEIWLYSFFNLGGIWGGWSTRSGRFTPGKDPVHSV
jgi:hypothetical protein